MSDTNKKRSIYYHKRGDKDRQIWFKECFESYPKGFMIVAGFCYKGKLKLKKVEPNTKINSNYYQTNVIAPIFRNEIPLLYGNQANMVAFHQDKASSHTSNSTRQFLDLMTAETSIKAIPFSHIPVKSPDASPMDFCAFGLLKQALGKRHPKTLAGLWKVVNDEWNKLDLTVLRKSLLAWKFRCRAIVKNQGKQIEHNKKRNYGLLNK